MKTPTKKVIIDFETYYHKETYSVSTMGYYNYTHDPRFDAYLMSVVSLDSIVVRKERATEIFIGNPKDFDWKMIKGFEIIAHNASFERAVIERLVELKIAPEFMLDCVYTCTADLSRYNKLPGSLDKSAMTIGIV